MAGTNWSESVEIAVARLAGRHGDAHFSLQQLVEEELERIVRETGSRGLTPEATLRRELQELRDREGIEFLGRGQYRLRAAPLVLPTATSGKCVLVIDPRSTSEPERLYRFAPDHLDVAARAVGQWVVYRRSLSGISGYHAVARVEQIVRDPSNPEAMLALIEPGSYLKFGRDVPAPADGSAAVQPISDEEFDRILALGLIDEDELLPRDDPRDTPERLYDPQAQEPFAGPVERETVLTSRKVRDRQFRKRVLDAYDNRCALTGMRLMNGGGRAEAIADVHAP